jgi:hypothetical protein
MSNMTPGPMLSARLRAEAAMAEARRRVRGPMMGIIIVAILGILVSISSIAVFIPTFLAQAKQDADFSEAMGVAYAICAACGLMCVVWVAIHIMVIVRAVKVTRLTNRRGAITTVVLSVLPGLTLFGYFGLPFVIWALCVLHSPQVKTSFTG